MKTAKCGVRRQSEAATALWILKGFKARQSKAGSRYACRRTPNLFFSSLLEPTALTWTRSNSKSEIRNPKFYGVPHMDKFDLEKRTKQFALKVISFASSLPQSKSCAVIEYQLVKAGTSVGANYREANRAESRNDFIHKIGIVEKESSESRYWLELCDEAGFGNVAQRKWLLQEASELLAIFTSIGKSTKTNRAHA